MIERRRGVAIQGASKGSGPASSEDGRSLPKGPVRLPSAARFDGHEPCGFLVSGPFAADDIVCATSVVSGGRGDMSNNPTPPSDKPENGFSNFDPSSLPERPEDSFPDPDAWVFAETSAPAPIQIEQPAAPEPAPVAPEPVVPAPMTPAPPGVPHRKPSDPAQGHVAPPPSPTPATPATPVAAATPPAPPATPPATPPAPPAPPEPPVPMGSSPTDSRADQMVGRTSGLAAGSLILGILGFLSCGLTGLVGIVMGIVAMVSIGRSQGQVRGQGMAVAGLVLSVVSLSSLLFYTVLAGIVLPRISLAAEEAFFNEAVSRLQRVVSVTQRYERGNGQQLPPANDWVNVLAVDQMLLAHPDDPTSSRAYAMNILLDRIDRRDLVDAENTVLFFEARPGSPLAGGPELLPTHPRYSEGYLVIYANGDLGVVPNHDLATVVWKP